MKEKTKGNKTAKDRKIERGISIQYVTDIQRPALPEETEGGLLFPSGEQTQCIDQTITIASMRKHTRN